MIFFSRPKALQGDGVSSLYTPEKTEGSKTIAKNQKQCEFILLLLLRSRAMLAKGRTQHAARPVKMGRDGSIGLVSITGAIRPAGGITLMKHFIGGK